MRIKDGQCLKDNELGTSWLGACVAAENCRPILMLALFKEALGKTCHPCQSCWTLKREGKPRAIADHLASIAKERQAR